MRRTELDLSVFRPRCWACALASTLTTLPFGVASFTARVDDITPAGDITCRWNPRTSAACWSSLGASSAAGRPSSSDQPRSDLLGLISGNPGLRGPAPGTTVRPAYSPVITCSAEARSRLTTTPHAQNHGRDASTANGTAVSSMYRRLLIRECQPVDANPLGAFDQTGRVVGIGWPFRAVGPCASVRVGRVPEYAAQHQSAESRISGRQSDPDCTRTVNSSPGSALAPRQSTRGNVDLPSGRLWFCFATRLVRLERPLSVLREKPDEGNRFGGR